MMSIGTTLRSEQRGDTLIIGHVSAYKLDTPCCRDIKHWLAAGIVQPVTEPRINERCELVGDPYWNLGYCEAQGLVCSECGGHINGHEYRQKVGQA